MSEGRNYLGLAEGDVEQAKIATPRLSHLYDLGDLTEVCTNCGIEGIDVVMTMNHIVPLGDYGVVILECPDCGSEHSEIVERKKEEDDV